MAMCQIYLSGQRLTEYIISPFWNTRFIHKVDIDFLIKKKKIQYMELQQQMPVNHHLHAAKKWKNYYKRLVLARMFLFFDGPFITRPMMMVLFGEVFLMVKVLHIINTRRKKK